jgi:hypothetical protein
MLRGLVLQGVSGALTVLMKDAIKPNLMQTLEVSWLTPGSSVHLLYSEPGDYHAAFPCRIRHLF